MRMIDASYFDLNLKKKYKPDIRIPRTVSIVTVAGDVKMSNTASATNIIAVRRKMIVPPLILNGICDPFNLL